LVLVLAVLAGCADTAESDRSIETFEITVATPSSETDVPPQPRTVQFLGPGRGESALITDGSDNGLVVDAGADSNATRVRGAMARTAVESYDLWITGFNETRLGGAPTLVRERPPENIGFNGLTTSSPVYDRFLRAVVAVGRQYVLFGERNPFRYARAGGRLAVLAPPEDDLADGDPAHNELVVTYEAHDTAVLWLGDPGQAERQWLLENDETALDASVLVLSAGASPTDRLLDAVDPETVVVQGSEGANRTVAAVEDAGADVYRPGIEGTVTLRIRADGPSVERGTPTPAVETTTPPPTATPSPGTTAAG
jgi:beta-lactamase superfamily II metal-dependent hydrolase